MAQTRISTDSDNGRLGMVSFAAIMMLLIGIFQILQGLAALLNDRFFVVGPNYTYNVDITTWGWIHLFMGIIIALAGGFVLSGRAWARAVGIALALMSAVANFFYLPYYPLWAILVIAFDIAVIWALAGYSRVQAGYIGTKGGTATTEPYTDTPPSDIEEDLEELRTMYGKGLLSDAEYERAKAKLLQEETI